MYKYNLYWYSNKSVSICEVNSRVTTCNKYMHMMYTCYMYRIIGYTIILYCICDKASFHDVINSCVSYIQIYIILTYIKIIYF